MNDLPKRKPSRLKEYDYSQSGAYFITMCTHKRLGILSQIRRGGALLLPFGKIAETEITNLQIRYEILIDKYVIMPNHIHMVVVLQRTREEQSPSPTISDIVCAFKSTVTKSANKIDNTPGRQIFQRSYHDHIIRNETDYQEIWQYIDTNPLKWEEDCFYENSQVCLLTNDVIRLAGFYKNLFDIDNGSSDNVHQFIISEETTLTIHNDGIQRECDSHNICIAFTVEDVDVEFERLKELGVEIVDPPTIRPWGAKNMSFLDPDNNLITFRCFPK